MAHDLKAFINATLREHFVFMRGSKMDCVASQPPQHNSDLIWSLHIASEDNNDKPDRSLVLFSKWWSGSHVLL